MAPPMYTAVRMVKMNACSTATRISKPVNRMSMANGKGRMTSSAVFENRAADSTAKVTSSRWPASMLAKSRTAREKGRTKTVEIEAVCKRHGVALIEAALKFPSLHPSVVSLIPGGQRPQEVESNRRIMDTEIPAELWRDLKAEGLMREDAPTN